jgi:hypothetical protein
MFSVIDAFFDIRCSPIYAEKSITVEGRSAIRIEGPGSVN